MLSHLSGSQSTLPLSHLIFQKYRNTSSYPHRDLLSVGLLGTHALLFSEVLQVLLMQPDLRTTDSRLTPSIIFIHLFLPFSLQIVLYTLQFFQNFHLVSFDFDNSAVKQ